MSSTTATKIILLGLCAMSVGAASARGEVARVEIARRVDVQGSGYEKIAGTIHFAVSPSDPRNAIIVDLDKAPRNAAGLVEFSADFYLLRPKDPARSNGSALVEVSNRGGRGLLRQFNRGGPQSDPETDADLGDKFLMRFGFTAAWVGWEFDVADNPGAMRIYVPFAKDGGKTISGVVRAAFIPSSRVSEFVLRDLGRYDAVDPDGSDSVLTVRPAFLGKSEIVPRQRWHLKGHTVTLEGGFDAGKTYEVAYRAENPPVAGLGFAAMRDFSSWLKHAAGGPMPPVRYAYAFGASQSGRYLRDFLYEGFNTDERDRQVFDGVIAHIAGAARIDLNRRWSTPIGLGVHSATSFPFADASLRDPISGAQEGALDNPRARAHLPKVFYTNTPVEYRGTGRVAALIHTTPDGSSDITPPDNVRVYFLAGTQHSPGRFPPTITAGQQPDNPVEYAWPLRALLLAMHRWVSAGTPPPASAYPKIADGTLVKASAVTFPAIPGVPSPRALSAGWRVANTIIKMPAMVSGDFVSGAGAGAALPLLVPAVDEDGNERSGIRMPDISVPLGTYTGWNFRNPTTGSPTELASLLGSALYFPSTRAARQAAKDPRRSVEERYPSREPYLAQVEKAADALVARGYLLIDDVPRIVQRASDTWDLVTTRPSTAGR
ncbi:MAG TPA: alpha/beta hydrolase domain-containing protein [Vicinamibacterales bacterium]|nr:alpha/beta hydrolase domain-containing protein [Vicinamibacterales bacterium]